jgi:hypothetical protein
MTIRIYNIHNDFLIFFSMNQHLDPRQGYEIVFREHRKRHLSMLCMATYYKKNYYSRDISETLGTKTMFLKNVDAEHKASSNSLTDQLLLFGGRGKSQCPL